LDNEKKVFGENDLGQIVTKSRHAGIRHAVGIADGRDHKQIESVEISLILGKPWMVAGYVERRG
jgi:hypothetical protein